MAYHDHKRSSRRGPSDDYSPSSSGNATPTAPAPVPSSYLGGFVGGFGGLVRRFSDMTSAQHGQKDGGGATPHGNDPLSWPYHLNNGITGVWNPPSNHHVHRAPSPMIMAAPPPLEPLELKGFRDDTTEAARLLTPAVAEEIRIMVPERQRIVDEWNLVYSLDQDGASLGTLYSKCDGFDGTRASFVLVVRDTEGGLFGAYLSDSPRPQAHYFGNGECFLWRASVIDSVLASLPPPPSEDTTNLTRVTTIRSPTRSSVPKPRPPPPSPPEEDLIDFSDDPPPGTSSIPSLIPAPIPVPAPIPGPAPALAPPAPLAPSRAASPAVSLGPSIRFKAFPYSGENDFYIYCQPHWLSVGGGDGHYGLWLNDSLEKGISSRCPTFGNEPLSDEGEKFRVLGVEMWLIGRGGSR